MNPAPAYPYPTFAPSYPHRTGWTAAPPPRAHSAPPPAAPPAYSAPAPAAPAGSAPMPPNGWVPAARAGWTPDPYGSVAVLDDSPELAPSWLCALLGVWLLFALVTAAVLML